ncbi:MAG: PIN domain-containing protein [Myxococcaceae bacterium]
MSALVIDTSSWVTYFAGDRESPIDDALHEGRGYLSPIVAAELLSGNMTAREQRLLTDLLKDLPLSPVPFEHWLRVGALRRTLRAKGLSVSTPDAHIAMCAIDLAGELLSEDTVFAKIARVVPLRLAK